jgi:hypothetical protein
MKPIVSTSEAEEGSVRMSLQALGESLRDGLAGALLDFPIWECPALAFAGLVLLLGVCLVVIWPFHAWETHPPQIPPPYPGRGRRFVTRQKQRRRYRHRYGVE